MGAAEFPRTGVHFTLCPDEPYTTQARALRELDSADTVIVDTFSMNCIGPAG